jgi:hypothetical protein
MGGNRNAYGILVGKPEGKRLLPRPKHRREYQMKMDLPELEWRRLLFLPGSGQRHVAGCCECGNEISVYIKCEEFLD